MNCVSLSFRSAELHIRQRFAFSNAEQARIIKELLSGNDISECVVLCTCNRTEVYYTAKTPLFDTVISVLASYAGVDVRALSRHLLLYMEDKALYHLFKVASGIDSMVLGEDEILSQTKNAYLRAVKQNAVGYQLNMIFQAAFAAAKKIKTETQLSKASVSVATLASNAAANFSKAPTVLVIGGSGATGATVLKNLVSHKNIRVIATLRRHNLPFALLGDSAVEAVEYQDRYRHIGACDCVISATSGPHFTVTACELMRHIRDGKERLLIDLAVPPDIEPSVKELENIQLLNIDYFKELSRENNVKKQSSAQEALDIITQAVDTLKKDLIYHDFRPQLSDVKAGLGDAPFEVMLYRMKSDLTADAFSEVIAVLNSFGR